MKSPPLSLAHFGLRTMDLDGAIEWYAKALGAEVRFRNDIAAFMSFDEEHHRFVLWSDGDTETRPENARGIDHVGFSCGTPSALADHYGRLKEIGIRPDLAVNHHFTSSLYFHDPDGNEIELTCDNFPTKSDCNAFMATSSMRAAMQPPLFGAAFDPDVLFDMRRAGSTDDEMARIGL